MKENSQDSNGPVSVFQQAESMGHEQVVHCYDEHTGLKAIIGIHNTVLGPALGGTRIWNYESEEEALVDVLRLSRGMTLKNSLAGLNIGGGKAVIIGDASKIKTEALLRRFGRFIDSLGGRYVTAEDVNMSPREIEFMAMETDFVTGMPEILGGGGDPSPVTAYGTYMGMKAAVKKAYGSDSLEGKKIIVQGVGQVGSYLVDHLMKENADVTITDISEERISKVSNKHSVNVIAGNEIFDADMEIYAPCALGATVNSDSIKRLKAQVIAGGANNQLSDEEVHGKELREKGIIYAPDFLINAGGVINVYLEYIGEHKREIALQKAENIYDTCFTVLEEADKRNLSTHEVAMKLAMERIEKVGQVKLPYG